jgi:hypothetical protein
MYFICESFIFAGRSVHYTAGVNGIMRLILCIILTCMGSAVAAQQGYVINEDDSTFSGYVRFYRGSVDEEPGIEVWKTKTDKSPRRFPMTTITEYAIKKDTFKVLHQYRPFPDKELFFEVMEARIVMHGKVNLYEIEYYQKSVGVYVTVGAITAGVGTGGVPGGIRGAGMPRNKPVHAYVLEHKKTGFLEAIQPREKELEEPLKNFFPEGYIAKYAEVKGKGKIKYDAIPDMVKLYNSK